MKLADIQNLTDKFPKLNTDDDQKKLHEYMRSIGLDPGNLYQELEMSSRFVDTHRDTSFSNAVLQLHSHTFYEVLFCRSCDGVEYLVGTDRYRLQKGDIVLVTPGTSHRPLLSPNMSEPYKRDVLWISTDFIDILNHLAPDPMFTKHRRSNLIRTAGTNWSFLGALFASGVKESETKADGWEMAIIGNTMTLLTHLKRAFMDPAATPLQAEQPELLDQVLSYIEENLSKKITMKDIAHHFYVSESTISHAFRKKMGVSAYQYITQCRLIAAKTLIMDGVLLESAGQQVGFTDYSAFYRAFKQEYGISPRQFRKLQENVEGI